VLELAGRQIEVVHTPGHTSNHLCFAAGDRLFSGDHVMGWSTTVVIPPDGHMGAYMASLAKLQQRPETLYHPAHGEPVEDPQRLLRGLLTHRVQRERQLLRLVAEQPGTLEDCTARAYPALDPRLIPAARATALAHLITLEERVPWLALTSSGPLPEDCSPIAHQAADPGPPRHRPAGWRWLFPARHQDRQEQQEVERSSIDQLVVALRQNRNRWRSTACRAPSLPTARCACGIGAS
jgi:hypothetical protein